MERLWGLFSDVLFFRMAGIFVSILFVPAFVFGIASVWVIVFGFVLAFLFDARLKQILETSEPIQDKVKRGFAALKHYFLLMLEMSLIISIVPIIFLYSGYTNHVVSSLDAVFFNYSLLGFLKSGSYAQDDLNFQILIAATCPVLVSLAGTLFLSIRKLARTAKFILHREITDIENGQKIYHPVTHSFYQILSIHGFLIPLFPPILYGTFLFQSLHEYGFMDVKSAVMLALSFSTVYFSVGLFSITSVADSR